MVSIDTNVLIRLIVRDDEAQLRQATRFIAAGAWVSHLVIAEMSWVLDSVYGHSPRQIAEVVSMLLEHNEIIVQDPEVVATALEHFKGNTGIGFSDCLLLTIARSAGNVPFATFDRKLGKLSGAVKL